MKKYHIVFILFLPFILFAQELPNGWGLSNQLEYSFDVESEREILENWFNLDYRYKSFETGFRFEVFQPNDPNTSISRGKERFADIAFKYLKINIGKRREGLVLTAGNYYALFGRGMIVKSYEDRSIRIDNNLLGLKLEATYSDFALTLLSGSAANSQNERKNIIHAADIEYRGIKFLKMGATYSLNIADDISLPKTQLASIRFQPSYEFFDSYFEYGFKLNDDIKNAAFGDNETFIGKGIYGNINLYYQSFSLSGEYKLYDNFGFQSDDLTINYNTPPSVRRDYSYILFNRHPSPLDQNNEQGFQIEANYNMNDNTDFKISYGETKTLDSGSFYQRINNTNNKSVTVLQEIYFQASTMWNEKLYNAVAFGYNEESLTSTKNITGILETRYYLDEINTLKLTLEHQHTTDRFTGEKFFDDILVLEYLRSPYFYISFLTEMKTKEKTDGNTLRLFWNFVQVGYKFFENTDVSLLIGSRQAGNICIGGVCRYEPEFRGVELKMTTRLF